MEQETNIHFEIELKKLKLRAEHGMMFLGQIGRGKVPPEAVLALLDHVDACEKAREKPVRITVGAFLGTPAWRPSSELAEDEIGVVLDQVYQEIEAKGITVNVLYLTEERDIYRFITEELIHLTMNAARLPGTMTIFTYEDFHPNPRADIRKRCEDFIDFFVDKSYERFGRIYMNKEMTSAREWQDFRNSFDRFSLGEFKILSITIDGDAAVVEFDIDFVGHLQGDPELTRFAGRGQFRLVQRRNWWRLAQVQWPAQQG